MTADTPAPPAEAVEIAVRAWHNAVAPKPLPPHDAYDVLRSWATGPSPDLKPGQAGYRSHPDNWRSAKREWDRLHAAATATLQALAAAGWTLTGPGWQAVPKEATQEMKVAGLAGLGRAAPGPADMDLAYRAMLAAAPRPGAQP